MWVFFLILDLTYKFPNYINTESNLFDLTQNAVIIQSKPKILRFGSWVFFNLFIKNIHLFKSNLNNLIVSLTESLNKFLTEFGIVCSGINLKKRIKNLFNYNLKSF